MKRLFPPVHIEVEKGHGRIEERSIQTSAELNEYLDFPYIKQVYRIKRKITDLSKNKVTEETEFGITSLSNSRVTVQNLLKIRRGHWTVENKDHYVRDVTFKEDKSRVRTLNGPRIMATLRKLTIGIFRIAGFTNISEARMICGWDKNTLSKLLGINFL